MDWRFWILLAIDLALPAALFVARHWLKANIEKSVQYQFDAKLETLRSEFHKSEERFKQELQSKEAEISALRDSVMGGRTTRQAFIDKRRVEAVEHLWAAFVALSPYYVVSSFMSVLEIENASERAPRDPQLRKFFEILSGSVANVKAPDSLPKIEQLFVSPLAWAYFSAYQTVVMIAYAVAKALEAGLEDVHKLVKMNGANKMLKTALPHQSEYIDKYGFKGYHFLLDELEGKLILALRQTLEGEELDQASIIRSAEIIKMVKEVSKETEAAAVQVSE
jgi:hypothetical protein